MSCILVTIVREAPIMVEEAVVVESTSMFIASLTIMLKNKNYTTAFLLPFSPIQIYLCL